jgi:hypothetical protein
MLLHRFAVNQLIGIVMFEGKRVFGLWSLVLNRFDARKKFFRSLLHIRVMESARVKTRTALARWQGFEETEIGDIARR